MKISYINGDVLKIDAKGRRFLCHCCNDIGVMGAGVALAISKKWPIVKSEYLKWYKDGIEGLPFELGNFQIVSVDSVEPQPINESAINGRVFTYVVNLIGQEGIGVKNGKTPIRYNALRNGFLELSKIIVNSPNCSVHMPRIGCGLAGGRWEEVEPIILETLCEFGIPVTVYDFK